MSKHINAVVFDMGGVLLKTMDPKPREAMALRFGTTRKELESTIFSSRSSHLSESGEISDQDHWETVLQIFNQPTGDYLKIYDEYFSGDAIDEVLLNFAVSLKSLSKFSALYIFCTLKKLCASCIIISKNNFCTSYVYSVIPIIYPLLMSHKTIDFLLLHDARTNHVDHNLLVYVRYNLHYSMYFQKVNIYYGL